MFREIMDREDVTILLRGIVIGALLFVGLVAFAFILGVALSVFRTVGGL